MCVCGRACARVHARVYARVRMCVGWGEEEEEEEVEGEREGRCRRERERHVPAEIWRPNPQKCSSQKVGILYKSASLVPIGANLSDFSFIHWAHAPVACAACLSDFLTFKFLFILSTR